MSDENIELIKSFETYLDVQLKSMNIMNYEKFESILLVGNIFELALHEMKPLWFGAMDILISELFLNDKGKKTEIPVELAFSALEFCQNYYYLRDYFYYVYNVENSVKWNFNNNNIKIDLIDDSFQVQQFLEINNYYMKSIDIFSNYKSQSKKTADLVNEIDDEFTYSKEGEQAIKLCIEEAELKLSNYHYFLKEDLQFDHYSIEQFRGVYKLVLARALLSRYFSSKFHKKDEHRSYTLTINKKQFIEALIHDSGYDEDIINNVLLDISLDEFKISKNQGITSFPIIYNYVEDMYIMIPNIVCFCDIFISLRKLWALKDPGKYGKIVAPIVGNELSNKINDLLINNGFPYVIRKYNIGNNLPDIDVLAIWPEKEFGKVVFICETKNPIPELFGKDFVRSVGPKGFLPKAKKQLDKIKESLDPVKLRDFLVSRYPDGEFEYGVYGINFLIITSNNIGVFFSEGDYRIIDWETFRKIIISSQGDILHILRGLNKELLFESCKNCSNVTLFKTSIGKYNVEIPVISIKSLLEIK